MSCPVFSTNFVRPIPCEQPQLTIHVPVAMAPPNTVTLANGAVIDLDELGRIIAKNCPRFVCEPNVVVQSTQTVQAAPTGTGQTMQMQYD